MKTIQAFLFVNLILLTSYPVAEIKGQQCNVIKDSVTAGSGATSFSDYIYDPQGRISDVYYTDSGNISGANRAVKVYFDGGSQLPVEYRFFNTVGTPSVTGTTKYTRDGNNRIISVFDSSGQATTTHTVSYDGNGKISEIILSNSTGSPDFPASFKNIVWQNGNISTLNLELGSDTFELTVTTDNKNNVKKKLLPADGVADIFQTETANNITEVRFINDEVFAGSNYSAGDSALRQEYTYNLNNDVETMEEFPAPFNRGTSRTTKYFYDCATAIAILSTTTEINIYPNPSNDFISITDGHFKGVIKIYDTNGREVKSMEIAEQTSNLNISDLQPGMYCIEMAVGQKTYRGKVLKN